MDWKICFNSGLGPRVIWIAVCVKSVTFSYKMTKTLKCLDILAHRLSPISYWFQAISYRLNKNRSSKMNK
jgi:hypothetical protein